MNTYNVNDENFVNSTLYQNFIRQNPETGYLKIRAYAASSAIPIDGLKVVVSKVIDNNNVIFFEGYTDSSGIIEKISLPAPILDPNNMNKPGNIIYDLTTTYLPDNVSSKFLIRIYDGIYVIQNINVVPDMKLGGI